MSETEEIWCGTLAVETASCDRDRGHLGRQKGTGTERLSEETVTLHLSEATARELAERILPKRGRYEVTRVQTPQSSKGSPPVM